MVRVLSISLLLFAWLSCTFESASDEPYQDVIKFEDLSLIPYPVEVEELEGSFQFGDDLHLYFEEELSTEGNYLNNLLSVNLTNPPKVNSNTKSLKQSIRLSLIDEIIHLNHKEEAYRLKIESDNVQIEANHPTGIMRGIQTLRQLFVPAFHTQERRNQWNLPALKITDYPEFQHRGLLLDACRHFFEKEVILKYIDALAYYKMNVLHFHLTEDQGWRVPIEKYPLLNEISSWRLDSNGNQYGGYYTKEELIEIVDYATERHITVIPEIELPGHAQAALSAYPQYSCNGGPIEVANDWGVFKEIYCAGNDSTFLFLEDILTEVMQIFPSEYIHIGGDEAPKFRWENCAKCQKRMVEENLADEHELQSYFIQRIERFLNENNRKLIGWDEILEGGLSETAMVQSWRGMEGGQEAAEQGNDVIMSPTSHCYLDYSLSSIDLKKIYDFDPIPTALDPKHHHSILGGECNMWTERVPDEANLDSKVFPRMIGLAEVLWSYPENREFDKFYERLQKHYPSLTAFGIDYGLETIGAHLSQEFSENGILIYLEQNLSDLTLKYRWSGEDEYTNYETPLNLDQSGTLYVQAYKGQESYGEPIEQIYVSHLGLNKPVQYEQTYNDWYQGSSEEKSLTDGRVGAVNFRDGNWQGFWGTDGDFIVDLGENKKITRVSANFYQYANSWIFLPPKVEITYSEDGEIWSYFYTYEDDEIDLSNQQYTKKVSGQPPIGGKGFPKARYVRIHASNLGKVPDGHEAAGQDAWLFIDEIIIE